MYAIVEQGGKQYKVSQGDVINVDLAAISEDATTLEIDKVMMVSDGADIKVGAPYIEGAKVIAKFKADNAAEAVIKGKKLYPMHFRRRKNSACKIGHRQKYLQLVIDEIKI